MNPITNIQFIIMSLSNLENIIFKENNEKVYIFDIDDTLYKRNNLFLEEEMTGWSKIYKRLQSDYKNIPEFNQSIFNNYYENDELFKFILKVTYEFEKEKDGNFYNKYLSENILLKNKLNEIPYKKWCFTNGPKERAEKILNILGITECFEGVFYPVHDELIAKPRDDSYSFIERYLNITDNKNIYFYDDSKDNVEVAKKRNWNGVHVGEEDNIINLI